MYKLCNKKVDDDIIKYFKKENLDRFLNIKERENMNKYYIYNSKSEIEESDIPFPPDIIDLVRLHKIIRNRKVFKILEFD